MVRRDCAGSSSTHWSETMASASEENAKVAEQFQAVRASAFKLAGTCIGTRKLLARR